MDKVAQQRADAFKVGFLSKLAESGVMPDELYERVKQAFDPLTLALAGAGGATDAGQKLVGTGVDVGGSLLKNLAYAGVLAPLALGGVTGALEGKMTSPSSEDLETLRKSELAARYEQLAREIDERMSRKQGVPDR